MVCISISASGQTARQDKLYIDDGTGKFAILKSSPLGDNRCIYIPDPGATSNILLSNSLAGQILNGGLTVNGGEVINGGLTVHGGLTITGVLNLGASILGAASGGTGLDASAAGNGQLLIGNGSGFALGTINGTTHQLTVTNAAGTITLSTPQNIDVTSTPTFGSLTLGTASDQLALGAVGHIATVNAAAPTAATARYTIPDVGDANFVMTQGVQTINGDKTITGTVTLPSLTANKLLMVDAQNKVTTTDLSGIGTVTVASGGTNITSYTAGDILYATNATTLAKLPIGGDNQILTAESGVPVWQNAAAGFANPMTAQGDIIYGGVGGSATRLAAGANNQVLTISGGNPTWTNNGATVTSATNTPGALAANTDNYVLNASAAYFRLSNATASPIDLTGLDHTGFADGRVVTVVNTGSVAIVLKHQSANSLAGNQFDLPGATDVILGERGTATFIYDQTAGFWELESAN